MTSPSLADKRAWLTAHGFSIAAPHEHGLPHAQWLLAEPLSGDQVGPYRLWRATEEQLIEDAYADLCAEDRT